MLQQTKQFVFSAMPEPGFRPSRFARTSQGLHQGGQIPFPGWSSPALLLETKARDVVDRKREGQFLEGKRLTAATLSAADLSWADLSGADLNEAGLQGANLSGANLEGIKLYGTVFGNTRLVDTRGLDACDHEGPSTLDFRTLEISGMLPLVFLRGCGLSERLIEHLPSLLNQAIEFYSCFISYGHADKIIRAPTARPTPRTRYSLLAGRSSGASRRRYPRASPARHQTVGQSPAVLLQRLANQLVGGQ